MKKLFTIGIYDSTNDEFFSKLTENNIDTFCDIRRRRGVRGSKYSFVNSKKLQTKLSELRISYVHILDLSPTKEIREKQKEEDKRLKILKKERTGLGDAFIQAFKEDHLNNFDTNTFYELIGNNVKNVVLFCVENEHNACHRSLVANFLKENDSSIQIIHL